MIRKNPLRKNNSIRDRDRYLTVSNASYGSTHRSSTINSDRFGDLATQVTATDMNFVRGLTTLWVLLINLALIIVTAVKLKSDLFLIIFIVHILTSLVICISFLIHLYCDNRVKMAKPDILISSISGDWRPLRITIVFAICYFI